MKNFDSFAVLGLGRFGSNVAKELASLGKEVLVVDYDEDKVNEMAEFVTYGVTADVGQEGTLDGIGISNVDCAIISLTEDFEAALMAVTICKEKEVPYIIAKAMSERHARILLRVGANKVILPEKEMGSRLAHKLAGGSLFDALGESSDYSVSNLPVPDSWIGKTLGDIGVRMIYNVTIIAVQREEDLMLNPATDLTFEVGDRVYVLGKQEDILNLDHLAKEEEE